jgi:tripartite-type tricarboxylate transporter receptor subunit TctC
MTSNRRSALSRLFAATLTTLALPCVAPAMAQERWPTKPLRLIVPFPAGGTADVVGRILAQKLSVAWGQPVLIENRTGAGGNLGADVVAKAPPDGYTLLLASGSIPTVNPHLYRRMPFDARKDLLPITNVSTGSMIVVVPDASPAKNLKELIALAKSRPGALNYGSAGVGSQVHMASESLAYTTGIEVNHVPYRGETIALTDLIAGQLQMMVCNFAVGFAQLGNGRLRALAVTSKVRSQQLPNVPTVAESGYPGFESLGWFGLMGPAGIPNDTLAKISRDTVRALNETDVKARLYVQGMTAVGNSSTEFAKAIESESRRWAEIIKVRNISAN